jgi:hypothetical protein
MFYNFFTILCMEALSIIMYYCSAKVKISDIACLYVEVERLTPKIPCVYFYQTLEFLTELDKSFSPKIKE